MASAARRDRGTIGAIQKELTETFSQLADAKKHWDDLAQRGTQIANQIVNITGNMHTLSSDAWGALGKIPEVKQLVISKLERRRFAQLDQLAGILTDLTKLYMKIRTKVQNAEKAVQGAVQQLGIEALSEQPIFSLTPAIRYVEHSQEILTMFARDLLMKQTVYTDVAVQKDRNVLVAYLAAWLTSPMLDSVRIEEIMTAFTADESSYEPPQVSPMSSPSANRSSVAPPSPKAQSSPSDRAKSKSGKSKKKS